MLVDVRRGPDRLDTFEQELLLDEANLKITLQVLGRGFPVTRIDAETSLGPDWLLIWYLWPDRWYEVGAFFDARGAFRGHYVNLVRPPTFAENRWTVEDLFLDVWVPATGDPVILDEDELTEAVERGWVNPEERSRVEGLAASLVARARGRAARPFSTDWPPRDVRRWAPDLIPALRVRRDAIGTFHAARVSGRLIAFGLYVMGLVSATSIGFAWMTDAFTAAGPALRLWLMVIAAEAALLLPAALGGRLPATFWPRPPLTDERSLFVATLASGLVVLGLNERASWASALLPVYGTLGLFSVIFAVCRVYYDHEIPLFAIAGLVVTLAALVVLL
ncbi:MAG: DUF402 domain-containing protein [Gemmatimonadota bacterium]